MVVIVGRLFARVAAAEPAMQFDWRNTTVALAGLNVPVADLLGNFPAACYSIRRGFFRRSVAHRCPHEIDAMGRMQFFAA